MKLFCWFGKHDFRVVKKLSQSSKLIHCVRCGGNYGINFDVKAVLPFDDEMCSMYESCGKRGLKKYVSTKRFSFWW